MFNLFEKALINNCSRNPKMLRKKAKDVIITKDLNVINILENALIKKNQILKV